LINGLIGFIENIYLETYNGKSICIDFRPDFMKPGEVFRKVRIDYEFLFMPITQKSNKMSYYNKFQYAYAITTHLSQGSQYPKVLYYRENLGRRKYQCQVDYVGISRAEEEIIIAIDEPVFNF
jgi:ATP-dependent exoDNAse (exonuclease V) alpha subunit